MEILYGPETVPMHQRRPAWLQAQIDAKYDEATRHPRADIKAKGYTFIGAIDYRFGNEGHAVSAKDLLMLIASQSEQQPLKVLDVGTGNGDFVASLNEDAGLFDAYGLTAHDFRTYLSGDRRRGPSADLPEDHYLVRNAENLHRCLDDTFDVIVSSMCVTHLLDPLGFVEQAANALNEGGFLCLDRVEPELPRYTLAHCFAASDFELVPTADNVFTDINRFNPLLLQRVGPRPLALPLDYGAMGRRHVTYTADEATFSPGQEYLTE